MVFVGPHGPYAYFRKLLRRLDCFIQGRFFLKRNPQFGDAFSGKLSPMLGTTTLGMLFPPGGTFLDPPAKPLPASTEPAVK
jgi:hypothetical protein